MQRAWWSQQCWRRVRSSELCWPPLSHQRLSDAHVCCVCMCVCVCTCVYVRIVERKTERGQRGRGVFVSFVELLESKLVKWDDCRVYTYLSIEGKQTGTGAGLACWSLLSLRSAAFREQANSKWQWCSKPGPEGGAVRRETQGKLFKLPPWRESGVAEIALAA